MASCTPFQCKQRLSFFYMLRHCAPVPELYVTRDYHWLRYQQLNCPNDSSALAKTPQFTANPRGDESVICGTVTTLFGVGQICRLHF
jgi:hypothetical protein